MPIPTGGPGIPRRPEGGGSSTPPPRRGLPTPTKGQRGSENAGSPRTGLPVRRPAQSTRPVPPRPPAIEDDDAFEKIEGEDVYDFDDEAEDDSESFGREQPSQRPRPTPRRGASAAPRPAASEGSADVDDELDEESDVELATDEEAPARPSRRTPSRPSVSSRRRKPVLLEQDDDEEDIDDVPGNDLEDDEDLDEDVTNDDAEDLDEDTDEEDNEDTGKKSKSRRKSGSTNAAKKKNLFGGKGKKDESASGDKPEKKGIFGRRKEARLARAIPPSNDGQDNYLDEKNMLLKPFGRKRPKKDVSEFDARKNRQKKTAIVQFIFLALVALLVGSGLKNAIIPPDEMTQEEVQSIVDKSMGETGFPISQGAGFAQDFMKAYLAIDPANRISTRALGYFYTGSLAEDPSQLNRSTSATFKQTVLYGPTLYNSRAVSPTSGSFVFGALVQPESADFKAPADGSAAKWSFFTVNVFYDKATGGMYVTGDSPSVTPATAVANARSVPRPDVLGTEDAPDEVLSAVAPTINGYVRGYAKATAQSNEELRQYVIPNPTPDLLNGLGGRYTLPEDDTTAITYEVFATANPSEVKAKVVVNWTDEVSAGVASTYTSTYAMTLQKQSNGMYLVSKFAPYLYVPAPDPNAEEGS